MSDPSKRKSNIFQESPLIDQAQEKFPGCIFLVSISFVKRTSSFLRFTDFLLVAFSANFQRQKSLQNIKVGAVKMA